MKNLFVKTALVLCTTIIFLPATIFATEPQNTEVTSAEEGFTDSDPSVSYENDNSKKRMNLRVPNLRVPNLRQRMKRLLIKLIPIKKIRIRIFLHQEMTLVMVLNRILFML